MNFLSVESLAKSVNDRWLFRNVTLGIERGEKLVLVGENGTGKSTLVKIIAGLLPPDEGEVAVRDGISLGYLQQQMITAGEKTVREVIFNKDNEVALVVEDYKNAVNDPSTGSEKMQQLLEKMEQFNAWDYESKVEEVTGKLSIESLDQPFNELSGGQQKRVFLAQLLLAEPDLILMDEPTNHLDIDAIEWLEQYLSTQNITLLMVSHDRYFLDNVATSILELDRGNLYRYEGNYAYFLEKKAAREEQLKVEVTKAKNLLRKELDWMRRQPKARGTKSKSRIEAFYDIQEKASQNIKRDKLELDIKSSRQGGKILEVQGLQKNFDDKNIVNSFSYTFKKKDRIGVVGKNGTGKSTFLNLLTGKIKPDSGKVIPGLTTKFGYFTQESEDLNPKNRVIEELTQIAENFTLSDGSTISAARFLEMFLFPGERQYTFVEKLSGGERKRLQLMKVLIKNPNFLILDEPTNDFDIDSLNVLEDFLEKFSGCLLLVSHDRYFVDHLVDQLIVFEGEGEVNFYNGNYSAFREEMEEKEKADKIKAAKKQEQVKPSAEAPKKEKTKASYNEKREYETLQKEIEKLEKEKKQLVDKMTNQQLEYDELMENSQKIEAISEAIENKMLRWMELDELMK
ncbi:MAG: ABC-F family ATP-binding cassette domain-containing protein [Candidatus Cyclobacteriaceae bacterium M2_1C_046]